MTTKVEKKKRVDIIRKTMFFMSYYLITFLLIWLKKII